MSPHARKKIAVLVVVAALVIGLFASSGGTCTCAGVCDLADDVVEQLAVKC